jgi:hypothetical protein
MKTLSPTAFGHIPSAPRLIEQKLALEELPSIGAVRALATWTPDMLEKFERTAKDFEGPPRIDRSAAMSEFTYLAAEHRWTDAQILAALYDIDDRWGKFVKRPNRRSLLVDLVNRARQKFGYDIPEIDTKALIERLSKGSDATGQLVYGFEEFVATDFHINWLLEDLLAAGGFGMVTGFPGVGKTQFCIALGAHLAVGADRFLSWDNVGGAQRVLFLSLEMSGPPLHHFLSQIGRGYSNKKALNQNFLVAPFGTPMPLDVPEGQKFLSELLDTYQPNVVIIDSLQKIASKELTDEQAVKNLIHFLSVVRDKYGCAVVVVHHHRKKSNDAQKRDGVELSDVYGSTYAVTDVDWVLSLRKKTENVLTLDMLKNRLGAEKAAVDVTRDSDLGFDIDGMAASRQFGQRSGV